MYEAVKLVDKQHIVCFGKTVADAVREFIEVNVFLPAVVYAPDGRIVLRLIEGELPGEEVMETMRRPLAQVVGIDPRD